MSKKSIAHGVTLKVENRSGFDKSRFNALTTGVGTITPIVSQFMIPNSDVSMRLKISAQLPPLATDCFLRSHLKVEAFWVPMRICYGGFESWFCGREIYNASTDQFQRAYLPSLAIPDWLDIAKNLGVSTSNMWRDLESIYGAGSLLDYLGCYVPNDQVNKTCRIYTKGTNVGEYWIDDDPQTVPYHPSKGSPLINIFPFLAYHLIYDEYYRNKLVQRPAFCPPSSSPSSGGELEALALKLGHLPYIAIPEAFAYLGGASYAAGQDIYPSSSMVGIGYDNLFNGQLLGLRQRNYGDDYFTAATPNAQEGNPVQVSIVNNKFTIQALRLANAMQEFNEVNNFASPDYIQTLAARYGASLSAGIAQKPIYLGSADFPMYTSGVEQTSASEAGQGGVSTNPFVYDGLIGATAGRAHAEGSDFVCKFHVDEPGYFMVMVTLVPEAQYYQGVSNDLQNFASTSGSSVSQMPCALLEHIGNDVIWSSEINSAVDSQVFGYVQRYLAHKIGSLNQVHGKFRMNEDLGSFIIQRSFSGAPGINDSFLKVRTTDLDNVAAVSAGISGYGVMIDSAIDLFVSEPLSESALPALSNPAHEHGRSVYVRTGGSKLA